MSRATEQRFYDLWEQPPEDDDTDDLEIESWDDHPSLTVEQRNPTLR